MTERVYPDEMDSSREIQRIIKEVFLRRYGLARDWLREHFGNRKIRVVDIACGSGFGSAILSELGQTVGVDIDPESVEYAKTHYRNGGVKFVVGDADDPAFLDSLGRFDAVVSSGTIEHVADPTAFLGWMKRCLNPGGACVLTFPATFTMDWAAPHHKRDIKPKQASVLFCSSGFEIQKKFIEGHHLRMRDLKIETRENPELPVPPLRQWIGYYLTHPHHFAVRMYQITAGKGILFRDQEYLLTVDK
jgi:2-polyprenyl-3-methyl-5-hydroxy-6-metoxy-1,4-benzoquinol methylase